MQDDAERPRTAHTVPHAAIVKQFLPGSGFTAAAAAAAALLTSTLSGTNNLRPLTITLQHHSLT